MIQSPFVQAEELLKSNMIDECRNCIRRGLEENLSLVPFVEIFSEPIDKEHSITIVRPQKGYCTRRMILDGMSFYSVLVWGIVEFLLSIGKIHVILSLDNVTYLSDLGPSLLVNLQAKAQTLGGNVMCTNANEEIRRVWELFEKTDTEGFPKIYYSASDAVGSILGGR